jgi:hypothetical protein
MCVAPSCRRTGYTSRMSHAFDRARRSGAFRSRRRQIVLGAVTILLHLIVFDWFSGQLGMAQHETVRAEPPMQAELINDAPRPVPVAMPPPQPKLGLPPLPDLDPEPVAEAEPPPPPAQPPQPEPAAPGDGAGAPGDTGAQTAGQGGDAGAGAQAGQAGAGAPAGAQAQASPGAAPAEPASAAKPAAEVRHYKVDLPPSSEITLNVARVDANGTRWSGEESLAWQIGPSAAYRIQLEAGISVVFTRVNLLTVTSEGTVGEDGFNPTLMTEKRRGRALTATHFNRGDGTVTFSSSQAKYPLAAGAQDKASVTLQLVAIARADPKQLSGNIDIFVGEDRDASVFSFTVAGEEQIDTPLGRIATLHLVRAPKPGSYSSRLDLWLAPSYGWLPVQIRNLEASGAVTTQTARKIEKKDTGNS